VRVDADNKPGVLAKISKVFARHDINIGSVLQHGEPESKSVPVIIMCGPTDEATIKRVLKEIEELPETTSKPHFIRVEDSLEDLGKENEDEESHASLVSAAC
jgi:homoserine dehydrogenase